MTGLHALFLLAAGIGAGLAGTVAGLASLVSYPALLAAGLPPLPANVTNTVAVVFSGVGAALGSRPELHGQRRRVVRLSAISLAGGAAGSALLLLTPAEAFEVVVPWLIGGASIVLLVQPRLTRLHSSRRGDEGLAVTAAIFLVSVYGGYFGAAAGVLMLALLAAVSSETLARSNAVKNVVLCVANAVAAVGFIAFGPVRWSAAIPLAVGFLIGGRIGPAFVRRAPAGLLRLGIGIAGIALAVKLGRDAYG